MQEVLNISMTISAGWVSTPSTSRKQKTTCTPASRLYTATGVLLPLWPDYWRTADEKELFSNKELKDFLWQTMIETGANKLMLPAKTVVDTRPVLPTAMPTALPTLFFIMATFIIIRDDEDNADIIARISRMVYDAMR